MAETWVEKWNRESLQGNFEYTVIVYDECMNEWWEEKSMKYGMRLWFIFGEYPNGYVDVASDECDVIQYIPRPLAELIITAHNELVEGAPDCQDDCNEHKTCRGLR